MSEQIIKALKDIRDKCGEDIFNDIRRFKGAICDILPGSEREIKRIRKRLIDTVELGAYNSLKLAAIKNEIQIECSQLVTVLCNEGIDSVIAQDVIQSFAALFTTEEISIQQPEPSDTKQPQQFTDPRDGKVYRTVKIGNQVWMAENLNFDCPGSKCYDNDPQNAEKYGRLYDWDTAKKACPPGWHLPDYEEWQTLVEFAGRGRDKSRGSYKVAGKKLKAKSGWNDYQGKSGNGTDEFDFSALPGGYGGSDGSFDSVGYYGYWWSASEGSPGSNGYWCFSSASEGSSNYAYGQSMGHYHDRTREYNSPKSSLSSVRCLQNTTEDIFIQQTTPKPSSEEQPQQKYIETVKIETVPNSGTFTDPRDGKVYKTVKIGSQVWMAENLNFDCPGSKCYDNDPKNAEKYGRLYDWETAKKACPPGWHLPSKEEWQILVDFTHGNLRATSGRNINGTGEFGFSALPGGHGYSDGSFLCVGDRGNWWSASEYNSDYAYYRYMYYDYGGAGWLSSSKYSLFSVRCVQDTIQLLAALFTTEEIFIQQPIGEKLPQQKHIETVKIETVQNSGTFTDPRDGKVYKTVKIGSQVWMAENLNFDCPGSKCYDNDPKNAEKYGRLYDWGTAKKACPPGWHLPSKEEWQILVDYAGSDKVAGKKLKAKSGWDKNGNGTDEFDFSALPGGFGYSNGSFDGVGSNGNWWSASESESISNNAYNRVMRCISDYAYWYDYYKAFLFSVRCLQD